MRYFVAFLIFASITSLLARTADFYQWEDWSRPMEYCPNTGEIHITIKNFPDERGFAYISLFSGRDGITHLFSNVKKFPQLHSEMLGFIDLKERAIAVLRRDIVDNEVSVVFTNVPYGYYAVSVWHDWNRNNFMDLDGLGLPAEPYGTTRNPKTRHNPPRFDAARFRLESKNRFFTIIMKH